MLISMQKQLPLQHLQHLQQLHTVFGYFMGKRVGLLKGLGGQGACMLFKPRFIQSIHQARAHN